MEKVKEMIKKEAAFYEQQADEAGGSDALLSDLIEEAHHVGNFEDAFFSGATYGSQKFAYALQKLLES